MTTLCATSCGRPTTATLCRTCADQLAEALATLAAWTFGNPGHHHRWDKKAKRWTPTADLLPAGCHGSKPSSVFDSMSGRAARGRTQALAAELDTQTARQTRRGDQTGPRPAPDSKVWAPNGKVDRVERRLTRAVQTWVALLAKGDVVAPHVIVSGNVLARSCTWLLWHAHQIATHPQAGDAWREFTAVADDLGKLVDRPEDRVYVGPCWHQPTPDQPECVSDLYAKPGAASVQCRVCGHVVSVVERRAWLEAHFEEVELPAADVSRVLATIGLQVSRSLVSVWATRGLLTPVGRVNVGGHSRPTYRVGDVKGLAVRAAQGKIGA